MRKGRDREEKKGGGVRKKIKTFLVATNIVTSQPTGTPLERRNMRLRHGLLYLQAAL